MTACSLPAEHTVKVKPHTVSSASYSATDIRTPYCVHREHPPVMFRRASSEHWCICFINVKAMFNKILKKSNV